MSGEVLYRLGVALVDGYARVMFEMDVAQHGPLPEGPKIIAPNHPSTTDPALILSVIPDRVGILIDDRLFKAPVLGRYLEMTGHVPVVPGNGRAAFDEALRLLEAGQTIAIFPEGAISPLEGGFHKPRTGVARLALMTGAPVIPVGIHLDRSRIKLTETMIDGKMAVGTWYPQGPYAMTVGAPMTFQGDVDDREYVVGVAERIMQRIIQLSHQSALRLQTARGFAPVPVHDTGAFASLGSGSAGR